MVRLEFNRNDSIFNVKATFLPLRYINGVFAARVNTG